MIQITERPNYPIYRHFLYADVVELLSLVNKDYSISKGEFIDRLFPTKKDIDNTILEDVDPDSIPLESYDDSVENSDDKNLFAENVFKIIDSRCARNHENYPFEKKNGLIYVNKNHKKLKAYTFLLLSSHLGLIKDRTNRSFLTSDFELFSTEVMQSYLGTNATVTTFGAGGARNSIFKNGTIGEKFKKLSEHAFGEYIGKETDPSLNVTSGDRGLDIVGTFHFQDNLDSRLIIYGQCKCSNDWTDSIFEASNMSLNEIIKFKSDPISAMFTPFCFRNSFGGWAEDSKVRSILLFDRFRLMDFTDFNIQDTLVKSSNFIDNFLNYSEAIV